jgi:hypothetical protein
MLEIKNYFEITLFYIQFCSCSGFPRSMFILNPIPEITHPIAKIITEISIFPFERSSFPANLAFYEFSHRYWGASIQKYLKVKNSRLIDLIEDFWIDKQIGMNSFKVRKRCIVEEIKKEFLGVRKCFSLSIIECSQIWLINSANEHSLWTNGIHVYAKVTIFIHVN